MGKKAGNHSFRASNQLVKFEQQHKEKYSQYFGGIDKIYLWSVLHESYIK